MNPAVTFADPEAKVRSALLADLVGRPEAYAPDTAAQVSTSYPSTTLTGDVSHVQIELENGNLADYPVLERAQVRVTCHVAAGKRSNVKALASLALGLLGADVDILPITGRSDVITDPDTKNLMCWFLVRVNMRASLLAS